MYLYNMTTHVQTLLWVSNIWDCTAWVPASKGDTVKVGYTVGGTLKEFKFIYAVGSAPQS